MKKLFICTFFFVSLLTLQAKSEDSIDDLDYRNETYHKGFTDIAKPTGQWNGKIKKGTRAIIKQQFDLNCLDYRVT